MYGDPTIRYNVAMNWQQLIERNSKVMQGKPVIKGTRITVQLIMEMLAEGSSEADILKSFPHLRIDQIRAAIAYAAAALGADEIVLLGEQAA